MSERVLRLLVVAYIVTIAVLLMVSVIAHTFAIPVVNSVAGLLFVLVLFSGLLAIPIYVYKIQSTRLKGLKEKEQERSEAIIQEHSGEEVLGYIRVRRKVGSILGYSIVYEILVIAPNEVLVEGIRTETPQFGGGAIDHSYKKFAISESEIIEIELNKLIQVTLKITTKEKEYKWWVKGFIPEKKGVKLEDYKNILRQSFPDKLSVKK